MLNFQDSVETVLRTIAEYVQARVQNYLKKAERELDKGNYQESIVSATKALPLIFHSVHEYHRPSIGLGSFVRFRDKDIERMIKKLNDVLGEHQNQLNIRMYGISLAEYHRFKFITPIVHMFCGGNLEVTFTRSGEELDTLENAQFCLRFVIDTALLVQQNRPPGEIFLKNKLRQFRVVKKAPILIVPKTQNPEHIRDAEVDEILTEYFPNWDLEGYIAVLQDDQVAYIVEHAVEKIQEENS